MLRALGWFVVGMLSVLLVLELVLQVLPTSTATRTGYYIDPNIQTYPPGHVFQTSFGWSLERPQLHRANNFGFLAEHDFVPDPRATALIGDSYVEASMLPMSKRLAAQLELRQNGRRVYAMAGPGSSLLDYAERVRFAAEKLGTRDFVIVIERGDVMQSICGSGNVHAACLDAISLAPKIERSSSDDRLLTNVLRRSALAQYLFSQLRLNLQDMKSRAKQLFVRPNALPAAPVPSSDGARRIDAVIRSFFERLEPYRDSSFTLVLGSDLNALSVDRASAPELARVRLLEAAHAWGANVVDTEPLFRARMARGALALGVSPRDAHWNLLAIRVVADAMPTAGSPKR